MAAVLFGAALLRGQQGAFTESVTDRGMRIWSFPDDGHERFVLAVLVGVGSCDEARGHEGIAHFLEHVVLARTARRPKAAADPELTALHLQWNGVTTHEVTAYYLQGSTEDWRFAVDWLADHVLHPAFDPADVDMERRIVGAEIETRQPHAGEVTFEGMLYPRHALGRSVGGTSRSLAGIDRAALQHFHAVHYRAANVAVGFAGKVPQQECTEAIRAAFAGLASGKGAESTEVVRPRTGEINTGGIAVSPQASMVAGFHLPAATPRDLVMARLLGGYLNARFFDEVREARGLAYAPKVDVDAHRDTCRLDFEVDLPDRSDQVTVLEVVDALVQELQRVDVGRLATARASLAGLLEASSAEQLVDAMQLAWLVRRQGMSPGELSLATAAITERDIADFARSHLVPGNHFVVTNAPIARHFGFGTAAAMLFVLLLLLDGFGSFARTKALCAATASAVRRVRLPRRRGRSAVVAMRKEPAEPPIVKVPGDEMEKDIQRYFEEEERGSS